MQQRLLLLCLSEALRERRHLELVPLALLPHQRVALLDAEGNWRQTYEPLLALKRTHAGELPPPPAPPPPPPPEDDREL